MKLSDMSRYSVGCKEKMKVRFFERPLVNDCEMMRKQCVQNLSAIEAYLEVEQVDFMLPLDYHREFPLGRRGAHHPYSVVGIHISTVGICVHFKCGRSRASSKEF